MRKFIVLVIIFCAASVALPWVIGLRFPQWSVETSSVCPFCASRHVERDFRIGWDRMSFAYRHDAWDIPSEASVHLMRQPHQHTWLAFAITRFDDLQRRKESFETRDIEWTDFSRNYENDPRFRAYVEQMIAARVITRADAARFAGIERGVPEDRAKTVIAGFWSGLQDKAK